MNFELVIVEFHFLVLVPVALITNHKTQVVWSNNLDVLNDTMEVSVSGSFCMWLAFNDLGSHI